MNSQAFIVPGKIGRSSVFDGLLIYGFFVLFPSVNWQDFSLNPSRTWLSSISSSKIFF